MLKLLTCIVVKFWRQKKWIFQGPACSELQHWFLLLSLVFERVFCCVAQAGLELASLTALASYRYAPPFQAKNMHFQDTAGDMYPEKRGSK